MWIYVYYIDGMINVVVVIAWGCDLVSGVWLESCIAFGTCHHFLVWCGCEVYLHVASFNFHMVLLNYVCDFHCTF